MDDLAIVLTRNALFYQGGSPSNCCVLGFHTAIEKAVHGNRHDVQTFVTASWVDAGIYGDPGRADVNFISHEITEWMNDPFVNNIVPSWQAPLSSPPAMPDDSRDRRSAGVPFHECISGDAEWVHLSSAGGGAARSGLRGRFRRLRFEGAYSFPDTTMITAPLPCPGT